MTGQGKPLEPLLDRVTVEVIQEIVKRNFDEVRDANLLQNDQKPEAKHVEWFRGAAQTLLKVASEIEYEVGRRVEALKETPEEAIERNLDTIARAGGSLVNWQMDPDREEL